MDNATSLLKHVAEAASSRRDAAEELARKLGPEGVVWLDELLADYVFEGEPLDKVMVLARTYCDLPRRG